MRRLRLGSYGITAGAFVTMLLIPVPAKTLAALILAVALVPLVLYAWFHGERERKTWFHGERKTRRHAEQRTDTEEIIRIIVSHYNIATGRFDMTIKSPAGPVVRSLDIEQFQQWLLQQWWGKAPSLSTIRSVIASVEAIEKPASDKPDKPCDTTH